MPMSDDALLAQQRELQAEAAGVRADLRLDELLSAAGDPLLVGSAALGLMVWRDLDVDVHCARLERDVVLDVGARLARHPNVRAVNYRNDTGHWNTEPQKYPDGYYLGARYRADAGEEWRLDLWFIDEPRRQPSSAHLETLRRTVDDESRLAILRVKQAWHDRPEYGSTVTSWDIYRAVLDDGVRDSAAFDAWLAARASS
jgi:hypothetical protein